MGDILSPLLAWGQGNPLYALGIIVGFALGIFYGFDGWRGSTADLDFKDSPRVKNLIWVLGGAVVAFLGDIRTIDPTANKALLLFDYFLAFIVGLVAVVVLWGIVIAVSATFRKRSPNYSISDAVGDYFFFGYRHYRQQVEEKGFQRTGDDAETFHNQYITQLAYAISAAGANTTVQTRLNFVQQILRNITTVVNSYSRGENRGIRTNIMVVLDCTNEMREKLKFVSKDDRAKVTRCLVLKAYDEGFLDLVLPLPMLSEISNALFGAPKAFLDDSGIDIVDDTKRINFDSTISTPIQEELRKYFDARQYRSFASIKVFGQGSPIGVVNIEAREPYVFGRTKEEKERIARYLLPFCSTLGIILGQGV